jgi:hypothetical protein
MPVLDTQHFTIRWNAGLLPQRRVEAFARRAEGSYARLQRQLGLAGSDAVVPVHIVADPIAASASAEGIEIPVQSARSGRPHEVFAHELVHSLTAREWGYANPFLREGLAYYLTRSGAVRYGILDGGPSSRRSRGRWTLATCRAWSNHVVALAADDAQLPSLADLHTSAVFWALARFARTRLDICVSLNAATSFTCFVIDTHGIDVYRELYQAVGRQPGTAGELAGALGGDLGNTESAWGTFAQRRGLRDRAITAYYRGLRDRFGRVSRPTHRTNCWGCGHWWGRGERACPTCGRVRPPRARCR